MTTIPVKNLDGSQAGALELSDAVFGVRPHARCVQFAVRGHLAARRRGTHATKTRGFVSGGGRKPWRQKGTGRARQGSIRAPQWRGGAIIFGPQPRDYGFKVNRKVRLNAVRSALSELARDQRLIAVEAFSLPEPRTRRVVELLRTLGVEGSALLLTETVEPDLHRSARNIPTVKCLPVNGSSLHDLLSFDYVVATKAALRRLEATYA